MLLLAVVPLVAIGAPAAPTGPALVAYGASRDVVTPIHVKVMLDRLSVPGQETTVTCEVTADLDAPGTTATIELPANARYIGGELAWSGYIRKNETISFSAKIVFDAAGDTTILGRALRKIDARNAWGDLAAVYLSVGVAASRAGFAPVPRELRDHDAGLEKLPTGLLIKPPSVPRGYQSTVAPPPAHDAIPSASGRPSQMPCPAVDEKPGVPEQQRPCGTVSTSPEAGDVSGEAEPPAAPASPQGTLTVTGRWSYYDQDDVYTAASEYLVELIRADDSTHLAFCFTNQSGDYSCGPVTNPGAVGVQTRLYSWTNFNPNPDTLAVVNPDWGTTNDLTNSFKTRTGVAVLSDGTQSIGFWHVNNDDNYERAYWTLHDVIDEWRYIHFNGGGGEAGPTTVEWKIDSTVGTYYNPGGNVHLVGVDPLAHAGTVAKHEYGHNIMFTAYGGYMPPNPNCNPHTIQAALSAGCGWTEGWAEFLPAVVNNDPTFYWPSGASLDLEGPTWGTYGWDSGDWPEGRVAGAMWDMFDANNDGDDTYSDGTFSNFWDVVYNVNSDVFSDWWASWLARGHSNVSWGPIMGLLQNTIDYRSGPGNDDFAGRVTISSVPFGAYGLNTIGATTQGLDPSHPCASISYPRQSRSVWYAYTPSINDVYNINTSGSSYDTVLSVWSGSWGALANRACNDDSGGLTSALNSVLYVGTTYFIEASAYGANSGGSLDLYIAPRSGDLIFADGFTRDN